MAGPIKTLKQLSVLTKGVGKNDIYNALDQLALYGETEQLDNIIKKITDINKKYLDQKALAKELNDFLKKQLDMKMKVYELDKKANKDERTQANQIKKHLIDTNKLEEAINKHQAASLETQKKEVIAAGEKLKKTLSYLKVLGSIKKEGQEIFKISHDMQLQSNISWKEFTKLQQEAFKAVRELNKETGKQLHTAKEMVDMQNALLKGGWKDIDPTVLTNVSSATRMMATTLGEFPEELSTAFRMSFRQFGETTDNFITAMGNRLNAFSDSFGLSIGMLTGVVTQMSANTSFIHKNNMQAQIRANESLMKAAALSGRVGLTSTEFITQLANTAQFGTADEMSTLYQGGALLQGFDTGQFQQQMMSGNADLATQQLFSSIYETMQGVGNDQYLRNEYMKQIGGSFGLSQADMLQIMTNGGNLDEYSEEIQEKLLGVNTSMKDEIAGFKIDLLDTIQNYWHNTSIAEGYTKVMGSLGLYGISDIINISNVTLFAINRNVASINAQQKLAANKSGLQGPISAGKTGGLSNMQKAGGIVGGAAIGLGGNALGSSIQQNTNMGNTAANAIGGTTNILSGAAGGALIGGMIGGVPGAVVGGTIGALGGVINTTIGAKQRESAMDEIENNRRKAARQANPNPTRDPLVAAINHQTNVLSEVFSGETDKIVQASVTSKVYNKTTTKGTLNDNL